MVNNTQNYWTFRLFPTSGILENKKHDELISVTLSKGTNWIGVFSLTWGRKQMQFPKRRVFYSLEYRTMKKSKNPVILCSRWVSQGIGRKPCFDMRISRSRFIWFWIKFSSENVKNMCKLLCIKKIGAPSFSTQKQGSLERIQQSLMEYIRSYVTLDLRNWDQRVRYATFAHTTLQISTNCMPF
jgi:hypothetical protein